MEAIFESLGLENIVVLFNSVKNLLLSCVNLIGKCFAWMGPEFIAVLSVGVIIVVILRLMGR